MSRIISGGLAEKIYREVNGDLIEDDSELIDVLENYLVNHGWKSFWLSEGCDDYAETFINRGGEMLFLLVTIKGEVFLVDWKEVARDPAIANAYVWLTRNYFFEKNEARPRC
ncbi:MAG: hypothetical protein QXO75_01475 [Nitrososphaerota archaeon]